MKELMDRSCYSEDIWIIWDTYIQTYLTLRNYFESIEPEISEKDAEMGFNNVCKPGILALSSLIEQIEVTPAVPDCLNLQMNLLGLVKHTYEIFQKLIGLKGECKIETAVEEYFHQHSELEMFHKELKHLLPERKEHNLTP